MATIIVRHGVKEATYQVRYRIGKKQKTRTFKTYNEAQKFKEKIEEGDDSFRVKH